MRKILLAIITIAAIFVVHPANAQNLPLSQFTDGGLVQPADNIYTARPSVPGVTFRTHVGNLAALNAGTGLAIVSGTLQLQNPLPFAFTVAPNPNILAAQANTILQLGNADGFSTRAEVDSYGGSPFFTTVAIGSSAGTPIAIGSALEMGAFNSYGYNGSAIVGPKASLGFFTAQTWTTTHNGTYGRILLTPIGTTTAAEVVRFENDGGVTMPPTVTGGNKGAGTINVSGGFYVNGVLVTGGGGGGSGTVQSSTIGQVPVYIGTTTVAGGANFTIATGAMTLGVSGTAGSIKLGNATSGTVTIQPVTGALGTVTLSLPAATDTLMGKATTDTMTNKTFNTAGTGNTFQINSNGITAVSGTGSTVALTAGPTFTGTTTAANLTVTGTCTGCTGGGGGVTSITFNNGLSGGTVTGIGTSGLATIGSNTMLANFTSSIAVPIANATPSCPDTGGNHLNYTLGTGLSCGTTSSGGGGGSAFYNSLASITATGGM